MDKIYYISQGATVEEHLRCIAAVCSAGGRLIQLRLKDVSLEIYIRVAEAAKAICDRYQAHLIINDNVEVTRSVRAYGIHLGQKDMAPAEARGMLCDTMIVGGTANTLDDCLDLIKQDADYIGLGPFAPTQTKKELSPVLGLKGYTYIISALQKMGHVIPVYAIGGITENDIDDLQATGVYGIAVSGMLTQDDTDQIRTKIELTRKIFNEDCS